MSADRVRLDVKACGVARDGKTLVFVVTCPTFAVLHAEDAGTGQPEIYLLAQPKEGQC